MKRFFAYATKWPAIFLAAITLSTGSAFARPPGNELTAAAVMKVEHEWLAALHRRDVATLERVLGREFIDSDFQGDAITRAQYIAYLAQPIAQSVQRVWQRFEDTKVRFVAGGDIAIVTGIVITRPTPGAGASLKRRAVGHSRFTDVFVWRDARWQAVTGQETHFK